VTLFTAEEAEIFLDGLFEDGVSPHATWEAIEDYCDEQHGVFFELEAQAAGHEWVMRHVEAVRDR